MYQPVYGIVSDRHCSKETSSRCGKVERVDFSGLTHFGRTIEVCVTSLGRLPREDVEEAEEKIVKWAEDGKIKRVEDWATKLRKRKAFNIKQEQTERADIDITINENDK